MAKHPQVEGPYHLCGRFGPLRYSHIIPDWAYRDEIRGNGGQFVDLQELRPRGEAFTKPLLGEECEEMFSRWESQAKQAGKRSKPGSNYGPWLLKFATSISWRVLKYYQMQPEEELSEFTRWILQQPFVPGALACWKEFLLHDRQNGLWPLHRQHLFPVAADYTIRRALGFNIGSDGERIFVWSRFSFYMFVGVLLTTDPDALKSSAIEKDGGEFPSCIRCPASLARWLADTEQEAVRRALEYAKKRNITASDASCE
jgi:hypothetical protein